MNNYLLQVALGPVQGFIATARRSRDLWFGSWLLSELSKAAALRLIQDKHVSLIFPAVDDKEFLQPALASDKDSMSVANIVSARLSGLSEPEVQALAQAVICAVNKSWHCFCHESWQQIDREVKKLGGKDAGQFLCKEVWDAQRDDVLEIFWAAVPIAAGKEGYARADHDLRLAMAMRKSTRNIEPYRDRSAGFPKSSLDGSRSTVLREPGKGGGASMSARKMLRVRERLGIEPGEQLDLPGLVKRVKGSGRAFVPVARIAADAWIEKLNTSSPGDAAALRRLGQAYETLVGCGVATALKGSRYENRPCVKDFAYDGQLLYLARIDAELARLKREQKQQEESRRKGQPIPAYDEGEVNSAITGLGVMRRAVLDAQELLDKQAPSPYYAMLLADGDQMGALISKAVEAQDGAAAHRKVSAALAGFARAVPGLVESAAHRGVVIYAGGDDVLALVRVDKAVDCAKALADLFSRTLEGAVTELKALLKQELKEKYKAEDAPVPTLSVGIAIAHMLAPLSDVRAQAVRAEQLAKGNKLGAGQTRNALGLIIQPRSGGDHQARIRWDDAPGLQRLARWTADFGSGAIPAGLPYELRNLWEGEVKGVFPDASQCANLWRRELALVLGKKRDANGDSLRASMQRSLFESLTPPDPTHNAEQPALPALPFDPSEAISLMLAARWLFGHALEDVR